MRRPGCTPLPAPSKPQAAGHSRPFRHPGGHLEDNLCHPGGHLEDAEGHRLARSPSHPPAAIRRRLREAGPLAPGRRHRRLGISPLPAARGRRLAAVHPGGMPEPAARSVAGLAARAAGHAPMGVSSDLLGTCGGKTKSCRLERTWRSHARWAAAPPAGVPRAGHSKRMPAANSVAAPGVGQLAAALQAEGQVVSAASAAVLRAACRTEECAAVAPWASWAWERVRRAIRRLSVRRRSQEQVAANASTTRHPRHLRPPRSACGRGPTSGNQSPLGSAAGSPDLKLPAPLRHWAPGCTPWRGKTGVIC